MLGKNQEAKRVLHHAVLYNPFFQYGYYDYLEILAQEKNYEDLGYSIELLSCKTFSGPLCERIKGFHLSSPLYKEAYQSVFEKMTGGITFYQDYAVLFYRIGKYFLDKKPEVTEQFWTFIRDAHPGWGPFHSELASFYEYTLKDHTKAVAVLEACQINKAAASECKLRLTKGLSPPGSLESVIIWNWDF